MKKLSVLIAMLLCVTIGGVYAAWTYAGTNDIADSFAEAKVTIADVELLGANGVYKVESNLVLSIDQANEDHEAELVFGSNNGDADIFLKVTFTPSANAPKDIKDNGVPSELYFGTTVDMKYKMDADGNYDASVSDEDATEIFTFANHSDDKLDIVWTKEGNAFTYTLNEAALKSQIQLSRTFVLDIKSEHDAFRAALAGNIVVRVTDGIVN